LSPLIASLLHSLWLAGLAWLALVLGLKCIPAQSAAWRYRLSLGTVALVVLAWLGIWALLGNQSAPATSASAPLPTAQVAQRPVPAANAPAIVPAIVPVLNAGETRVAQLFPWQDWALIAWRAGVILGFCRIFTSVASARKLARAAEPVRDPRWLEALDLVCAQFGNRTAIGIKACRKIASPMVIGLLRPTILIPASLLTGVPPEALRAVLGHEIAHVVRWDYLVNLLQMGTEALLFFNPFVWALNRIVRREREACCDALASGGFADAAEYAEALVWWTRRAAALPSSAAMAMQGPENGHWLRDRILRLLNPADIPHSRAGWLGASGVVFAVGLFFVALAGGVRFTITELTAKERVELIRQKAAPFIKPDATSRENPQSRAFDGVITDDADRPIPGASWHMLSAFSVKSGTADALGHFAGTLPNEPLRLRVEAKGFAPAALKFETGVLAEAISVKLKPGIAFAVRCADATERPVQGVAVTLDYPMLAARRTALTGTDGMARFEHEPEGEFADLSLSAPGFRAMRFSRLQVVPQTVPAPFSLEKEAPFVLTVVDELDGSPVRDVVLRIHETWPENCPIPPWSNNGRKTDANGQAELEGLAPGTTYGLTAQGERRGVRFRINRAGKRASRCGCPANGGSSSR
jgi:beta-lactamase regulating signal transducer with metallopeptidase domain